MNIGAEEKVYKWHTMGYKITVDKNGIVHIEYFEGEWSPDDKAKEIGGVLDL